VIIKNVYQANKLTLNRDIFIRMSFCINKKIESTYQLKITPVCDKLFVALKNKKPRK